jgi:hypothetical protein
MVSSCQILWLKFCTHFSSLLSHPPWFDHPNNIWWRKYKVPHYVVFSILLLPLSYDQIFSSASCSQTPFICFLPLMRETSNITPVKVVCKVCELTLLLQVWTLWRFSNSLFFEVPPLASDALLTMLYPLLEIVLLTIDDFNILCLRASFLWLEKPRNCLGRDLNWILYFAWKKWISETPLEHLPYSPDLAPMWFLGFSNHEKGVLRQEISKWSMVCSTFSRSRWSIVRSASLAKGGTLKKRLLPHKVLTRSNKVSPWTLQMALVYKQQVQL